MAEGKKLARFWLQWSVMGICRYWIVPESSKTLGKLGVTLTTYWDLKNGINEMPFSDEWNLYDLRECGVCQARHSRGNFGRCPETGEEEFRRGNRDRPTDPCHPLRPIRPIFRHQRHRDRLDLPRHCPASEEEEARIRGRVEVQRSIPNWSRNRILVGRPRIRFRRRRGFRQIPRTSRDVLLPNRKRTGNRASPAGDCSNWVGGRHPTMLISNHRHQYASWAGRLLNWPSLILASRTIPGTCSGTPPHLLLHK